MLSDERRRESRAAILSGARWLQFNKDVFNVGQINTLATPLLDKVENSFVQAQLWGMNVGICIVGGNLARDLDALGGSALIDYALATMESMFGSSVSGAFVKGNNSSWLADPNSRGSYTYAMPGAVPLRTALATPVGNQIFFAGEALSVLKHSSLPGAYDTGQAAVQLVSRRWPPELERGGGGHIEAGSLSSASDQCLSPAQSEPL